MKTILSVAFILSFLCSYAQVPNTLYGLARNNNPAEVFLATIDPITGVITNLDTNSLSTVINLTGAAMDPTTNSYHFIGLNDIKTVDLNTGTLTNSAVITNPIANSYFDNFRFNNSDSTLYGLARRYIQATQTGEVYLATIDPPSGVITQISPTSVGQGFALEGSAIDPYQMVFYYTMLGELIGLDMYTGSIYSNVAVTFTSGGTFFGNFAYSCVDTTLYGLIRTNSPSNTFEVHLGKVNPNTGVVTTISPTSISNGGYSLNAGATIDPTNLIYYYNDGGPNLIGVSLITGLVVAQQPYIHDNGQYFDMMRIQSNCSKAKNALRPDPSTTSLEEEGLNIERLQVIPNPATASFTLKTMAEISSLEIHNTSGQLLKRLDYQQGQPINIDDLEVGVYFLKALTENQGITSVRFVKN